MAPVLTTALAALRRDLNARFPNRDKTTDGWIGDAAHRAGTSGHNPDDTSGSRAEYSDADTKQEVRALDVDEDLREPVTTMRDVILGIIATPGDRRRMRYMIYQDKIWSRNTDWEPRPYSGDYHHHGHFSGDPDTDEDGSPWTSLLTIGGAAMAGLVDNAERAVTAFYTGQDPVPFPAPWDAQGDAAEGGGYPNPWVRLERKVDRLQETVDALLLAVKALSVPAVDQEQVDAAVLQALESVRFDTRVVLPG